MQNKIDLENLSAEEKYIVLYAIAKNATKDYDFNNVVPINRIIRDCGIELSAWPMPGKVLLHDNLAESKKADGKWVIYVNYRVLHLLSGRYAITREFAGYLMDSVGISCEKETHAYLYFPLAVEWRNVLTSFLTFPFCRVVKLLREFSKGEYLTEDDWIGYLTHVMEATFYYAILCYQDIRNLAAALFQCKEGGISDEVSKFLVDLNVTLEDEFRIIEENSDLFQKN